MGFIRFILALSVLIAHSSPIVGFSIVPGYLAVQSFYIISGFYMAMVYVEKYSVTANPIANFYSNRFLRLYPLYLLTVVLTILLSLFFGLWLGSYGKLEYYFQAYNKQPDSLGALLTVLFFNITLIGQDVLTFFNINQSGDFYFLGLGTNIQLQELLFIPIAWTVSVELLFYLVTPFVANKKVKLLLLLLGIVMLLRLLLFLAFDVRTGFPIYRFAPTEFFWFLLGILSYKISKMHWYPRKIAGTPAVIIWIAALFSYKFYQVDWIIFGMTFLFTPIVFDAFSKSKTDRYLGDLSYPLYISHLLFLMIVTANSFPKQFGLGAPLFLITLIFSVLVYEFFLKPIDRWRSKRMTIHQPASPSLA